MEKHTAKCCLCRKAWGPHGDMGFACSEGKKIVKRMARASEKENKAAAREESEAEKE